MMRTVDDLKGEALLLWEAAEVYGLKPDSLATYVGIGVDRVYEWLGSGETPTDEEKAKIRAGVEKMKAEFEPKLEWREERPGVFTSKAWFGNLSGEPVEPSAEEMADRARSAAIQPLFAQLMKVASENEKPLVVMGWPDFAEVLALALKYGITIPQK